MMDSTMSMFLLSLLSVGFCNASDLNLLSENIPQPSDNGTTTTTSTTVTSENSSGAGTTTARPRIRKEYPRYRLEPMAIGGIGLISGLLITLATIGLFVFITKRKRAQFLYEPATTEPVVV